MMHTSTVLSSSLAGSVLPLRAPKRAFRFTQARVVDCRAAKQGAEDKMQTMPKVLALPMAAALAGMLLTSAVVPDEAMAARSSGRVGGSSFRSAPRRCVQCRLGVRCCTSAFP